MFQILWATERRDGSGVSFRHAMRLVVALAALGSTAANARADPLPAASLTSVGRAPYGRLIGGSSPAGFASAAATGGPLLAVEGAWATMLPAADDAARAGWAFGARAGWAFPNGLSGHLRYDDLGTSLPGMRTPLQLGSAGLRYTIPFVVPLPFAEVDAGPAFAGDTVQFGAGGALGVSLPLGRQVLVDVVGHDWLVPLGGSLRQTLTVGLGLAVTFASPAR